MRQRSTVILAIAACACAALALAAYWPGLYGTFLFDDYANLPALGSSGPIDNWPAFWRYITSGFNDPFGRPLTLLTFLLDARDWPADPFPFKRTSLILHLINGALLALLLARLGRALYADTRHTKAAPACGLEPPYADSNDGSTNARTPAPTAVRRADQPGRADQSARDFLRSGAPATDPPCATTDTTGTHHASAAPACGLEPPYADSDDGSTNAPTAARTPTRRADQGAPATDPPRAAANSVGTHRTTAAPACGLEPPYTDSDAAMAWRINLAALLGAALWLLHPLLVSTTLYIVQREAMLPATFILVGLLAWLHGREQLRRGYLRSGLVWTCVGLGGCTVLAVLAKANGTLLPLYALAIECTVLTRRPLPAGPARRAHRAALWVLAVIPGAAIVAHVVWVGVRGILSGDMGVRTWTIGQRLLTEPRVLWDYLSLLWLPRPFSHGLFNDQYVASTSLLHPATTLPALLGVLLLIAAAWWLRRRFPALALAVLFYFAGQLIESTSLPLELYFEHRNYVPALLMFWPLALWLADTRQLAWPKLVLMVALPLGLAVMTHARSELWGSPLEQTLLWAQINPQSPRAQANAAQTEIEAGQPQAALRRLQPLLAAEPDQAQLAFNWIDARCALGAVNPADIAMTREAMRTTANPGALLTTWFGRKLPEVAAEGCHGLSLTDLRELVDAGLENPRLAGAGRQQDLWYTRGQMALLQHQPDIALAAFTRALDWNVRAGMALQSAATLGAAGYPAQGLQLLDHYARARPDAMPPSFGMPALHAWVLTRQAYWPHEIAHLRRQLELDVATDKANTGHLVPDADTVH